MFVLWSLLLGRWSFWWPWHLRDIWVAFMPFLLSQTLSSLTTRVSEIWPAIGRCYNLHQSCLCCQESETGFKSSGGDKVSMLIYHKPTGTRQWVVPCLCIAVLFAAHTVYNVGHFMLEFSPSPLSMLEMQTESMVNNFLNNIELGERGVFFSNTCDHGCLGKAIALWALVTYIWHQQTGVSFCTRGCGQWERNRNDEGALANFSSKPPNSPGGPKKSTTLQ